MPVANEVAVHNGDIITVKSREERREGEWKLTVTGDGLTAKLTVRPGWKRTWKLQDRLPSGRLELRGVPVDIALPAVSREELLAELNRQQVVYNIDEEAVRQACTEAREMEIVIARGLAPRPPEDGRVEFLFSTEMTRKEVGEEEQVDYREMVIRASAAVGDLVAVKIPPQPGKPGMTVTGKVIPPPEPRDVELVAGKGTEVIDGRRCVATAEGRPQLSRRKGKVIIDILPVLTHRGDVDLASGNLKFKGCISVTGNVTETMQVTATRDVEIGGDVTQATVQAGGTINIHRNCIGSFLVAGGNKSIYQGAEPILADLAHQLSLLQAAAVQLEQSARKQGGANDYLNTGYLIGVLVENKFKKLPALAARLEQLLRGTEGGEEEQNLIQLGRELARSFGSPSAIQSLNPAKLGQMAAAVEEMAAFCQEISGEGGNITLSYALNSRLQASGWVKITGRGCFNCEIVAGGKVEIQGVFRGGSIYAGGDVYVQETGSSGGARTLVRVAEGRIIKSGKIWPNCTLQIGKRIRQVENEENRVMAYLDNEGDMILGVF
nr:FapA family protein [Moorella sulfitireducens]